MTRSPHLIVSLQYVRALAALWVVTFHYLKDMPTDHPITNMLVLIAKQGFVGVDIFFVISGFIISHSYQRHHESPLIFFIRRTARIYTGYWPVFGLVCLLILGTNNWQPHYDAIRSFFLLPQPVADNPISVVLWTLSRELIFYQFFCLFMLIPSPYRKNIFLTAMGLFGLYSAYWIAQLIPALHTIGHPSAPDAAQRTYANLLLQRHYLSPYLLEFIAGCLLFHRRPHLKSPLIAVAAGAAIFMAVNELAFAGTLDGMFFSYYRVLFSLPLSLALVLAALHYPHPRRTWFSQTAQAIGDSSYALYLLHMPLWTGLILPHISLHPTLATRLIAIIAAIIVALIWYRFIEHPLHRRLKQILATPKTASPLL